MCDGPNLQKQRNFFFWNFPLEMTVRSDCMVRIHVVRSASTIAETSSDGVDLFFLKSTLVTFFLISKIDNGSRVLKCGPRGCLNVAVLKCGTGCSNVAPVGAQMWRWVLECGDGSSYAANTINCCLCSHVYRYVRRHVHRHVYKHVCRHVHRHVCRHVYRNVHTHVYKHAR